MRVRQVNKHRHLHRRRRKTLRTGLVVAFFASLVAALLLGLRNSSSPSLLAEMARHGLRAATTELELTPDVRSGRKLLPYSVVPGGLRNVRDAQDSIEADPVVARHYRGLHVENLVLRRTPAAMDVFVSYRVQNAIYWTSHKVHMAKGELVLVDGKNMVRARCANRIVFELPPEAPKNPGDEPPPEVFEYGLPPVVSPPEPMLVELEAVPKPTPGYGPPLFVPPVFCCEEYRGGPVNPTAATPEPSTLLLLGAGILVVGLQMKGKRRG